MVAMVLLAAAAGQRLLLETGAQAPPPEAAAPGPDAAAYSAQNNTDGGYQVSFGSSSCANATGPICYNTAISGENLITGMWVNFLIGITLYLVFVLLRGKKGFEFYHARLLLPCVSCKPPQLQLHGHQRLWGWLLPVFKVSDEELVRSAGLDALIAVRIISFGVMLFLPMTIAAMAVLLPVNYTSDNYKLSAEEDGITDVYTSIFMRMTISNIRQGSPRLWVHFVFCMCNMLWSCWLIVEYYKEYIALRQMYLVRCTTVPGGAQPPPGSSGDTPLLTPTVAASRSPMKRGLALAQPASPPRRGPGGGGLLKAATMGAGAAAGAAGASALASLGSLGRAVNRLKLPRRHASGANEDFGEFAFRPSRFSTPSGSPDGGSPTHAPARDLAATGSIFSYAGPSRFGHSRNPSKGSPAVAAAKASPPGAAVTADGSSAAVAGLAAALAALPPGSPLQHDSSGARGGIELSKAVTGTARSGAAVDWERDGASSTGCSTPISDFGAGGRAKRPLLQEQALRSSDRLPSSQEREQREHYAGPAFAAAAAAAAAEVQGQLGQADVRLTPLSAAASALRPAPKPAEVDRSLSFGANLRSISLGSELGAAEGDEHADAASSPPLRPRSASTGSAADDSSHGGMLRSTPGSAAELLPAAQQCSSSQAAEPSGGSTAALLPPGGVLDSSASGAAPEPLPSRPQHGPTSSFEVASALGFAQRPPDPEEIYAAMLSKSAAAAAAASKSAALRRGSGPGDGDGGGEGIATSWWKAYQGDVDMPRLLHPNQSITFKGAVRLARRPGTGSHLHANASLFTCLVMDMPLERLKLRRIGVFPVAWRSFQLEPARSLGRAGTLGTLGGGSLAPDQEDISSVLDELEQGLPPNSARDEVDAHAMGLKSILARLGALWKHRSRYAEWRRDVRWAMYNKRVRIATEMFSELFGPDFDSIIPIYPTASVDKLAHKWDAKLAVLERLQLALAETPRHKARRVAKFKQRIVALSREVEALQGDIATERDAVLSDLPSTCFFATFRSQQAAAIASQTNLNPIMQRLFVVQPAPRPDDVNWPALQRSWWQRTMRPLYALPIILFFMLLPIGMFTGAFAQLSIALCGSPQDPGSRSDAWYCSDDRWATFLRNTLTSLAPSIVLSVYHMVFLPVMVYYAAQMEGQHVSLSALDRRCADLFFYWDVFNIFLGALFGGTVLAELKTFLTNPSEIWRALGSAIPAASNFFINYVMYRALVMSAFRLFYPHQAIVSSLLKCLRILPKSKTQRDKLLDVPPRNCRYGRDIGIPVLMNFVMVCSMSVTSPLILPFGLLYFVGLWAVWRYQALYVYQRQYESGGQFWPLVAHKVVGCQLIMVVFTASVLLFKGGYTQATLLYVGGPVFLLRFENYLVKRYDDLVRQVPLMAVHTAGRGSVPADIYTPPPLRSGGHGWHPEWGKVWQHWGIGRYTI